MTTEEKLKISRARLQKLYEDAFKNIDDAIEVIKKGNTARLARKALENDNGKSP